jgi:HEAT repeat protein
MRSIRAVVSIALVASACASAPAAPPAPPEPPFEQKMSWILRLEDQRVLRDPAPQVPPVTVPVRGQPAPAPPPTPDLLRLLNDGEARVRRRAALAVGRVGLPDGVPPLVALLADSDPEVRQMSAFALGLIGDSGAFDPLLAALNDSTAMVKGSAAEALGLIGDARAADAIARMVAGIMDAGGFTGPPAGDADLRRDTPEAAFRLGVVALVRLNAYEPLAAAVLDAGGQPRVRWWPVAFSLQSLADPRGLPALRTLAQDSQSSTRAFAAKGLGALKDRSAVPILSQVVSGPDTAAALEAIRALGLIGDQAATPVLLKIAGDPKGHILRRLEAVSAVGALDGEGISDTLLDILADPNPAVRAAALRAAARSDPEGFIRILSALDPDPHWTVRAVLAEVLATLPPELGLPRLRLMLRDEDQRVVPHVLTALTALNAPDTASVLVERLKADDAFVRAAAANGLGRVRSPQGAPALAEAYRVGRRDATYAARAAALDALVAYGESAARPVLEEALKDPDWSVRLKASALLQKFGASSDVQAAVRPATAAPGDVYQDPELVNPTVSTQAYLETDRGTIQIELAVLDAPLTVKNFIQLARKGYFDGLVVHRVMPDFAVQTGDPRGDGEGGPGYTIRDELNERPFVRGTVGMARDGKDTGGSQFFVAGAPQPLFDARYTAFGRVVNGLDVIDQIEPWDVVRRVRIWDGKTPQ